MVTITAQPVSASPTCSAALKMYDRSAEPSGPGGVPTASRITSAPATPLGDVGRERQAPLGGVVRDQLVEARLVDRHHAPLEPVDLRGVDVAADDVVAHVGEAGARDQPDVPSTDDADLHGRFTYHDSGPDSPSDGLRRRRDVMLLAAGRSTRLGALGLAAAQAAGPDLRLPGHPLRAAAARARRRARAGGQRLPPRRPGARDAGRRARAAGCAVGYSVEAELLGTGGGIAKRAAAARAPGRCWS